MSAVVADTHAIVWYLATPERLSANALAALEDADKAGGPIYVASISIVEIVYLIERDRIPNTFLGRLSDELSLTNSRLNIVPLDLSVAQSMREIPRALVPEMPDRIITATALYLGVPLVTRDSKIRNAPISTIW